MGKPQAAQQVSQLQTMTTEQIQQELQSLKQNSKEGAPNETKTTEGGQPIVETAPAVDAKLPEKVNANNTRANANRTDAGVDANVTSAVPTGMPIPDTNVQPDAVRKGRDEKYGIDVIFSKNLAWMRGADVTHERRHHRISEHRLQARRHVTSDCRRQAEEKILLGACPGLAILIGKSQARRIAAVGSAAMQQRALKNHTGTSRHDQRNQQFRYGRRRWCVIVKTIIGAGHFGVAPQMAARNDLGAPIDCGESVNGDDGADADCRARAGNGIKSIVRVNRLCSLTW